MENTKNATNEKITWNDLETMLATEIVKKAKRETKKWFSAWLLTAALLIITNIFWYIAYSLESFFLFGGKKNEITQTEQKGYRSQCDYWGSAYFSSSVDVGEELAADPGKYCIRTVYVFSTALRKENGNV